MTLAIYLASKQPQRVKDSGECQIGYTHYHSQTRNFTDTEWSQLCILAKSLLATTKILHGPNGTGDPIVDDTEISLNGDVSQDHDHESFVICKKKYENFSFCKTAHKPYDEFVVAILCIVNTVAPGALDISSDGSARDWAAGLTLAKSVLDSCKIPDKV